MPFAEPVIAETFRNGVPRNVRTYFLNKNGSNGGNGKKSNEGRGGEKRWYFDIASSKRD